MQPLSEKIGLHIDSAHSTAILHTQLRLHLRSQQKATYVTKSKPKFWIQLNENNHTNRSMVKNKKTKKQRKVLLVPLEKCVFEYARGKAEAVYPEGRTWLVNETKTTVWINMEACEMEKIVKEVVFILLKSVTEK